MKRKMIALVTAIIIAMTAQAQSPFFKLKERTLSLCCHGYDYSGDKSDHFTFHILICC